MVACQIFVLFSCKDFQLSYAALAGIMLGYLKRSFFTGLVLTLPIGITLFVVCLLLRYVGEPASNVLFCWLDWGIRDSSLVWLIINTISVGIVIFSIIAIGAISKLFLGKLAIGLTERIINHVPFVRNVYNTVKQVVDTFGANHKEIFSKTVLIEYPKDNCYALAFLTSEAEGEVQDKTGQFVVNVFLPTTPNPTSGFLLMVPKDKIIDLDMSVADGMKLIISGGVVVPPYEKRKG